MADYYWNGTTANAGTSTNYTNAASGATGLPVTGDSLTIDHRASLGMTTGLAALTGVVLTKLHIKASVSNSLTFGTTTTKFQIGATEVRIGDSGGDGLSNAGASLINLNLEASAAVVHVVGTAPRASAAGYPPLMIIGSAISKITVQSGIVGIAWGLGETATAGEVSAVGDGADVFCGAGLTVTTAQKTAGSLALNSAPTTLSVSGGGSCNVYGDFRIPTVNANGSINLLNRRTPKSVTNIAMAVDVATATSAAHGFSNGDYVHVTGVTTTAFNGIFIIEGVAANTFDYIVEANPAAPGAVTGVLATRMAVGTLNLYAGARVRVADSPLPIHVEQINLYGDAVIERNAAVPSHFGYKRITEYRGSLQLRAA